MSKITAYTALATTATNDQLVIVDVSDTTMAASGTTKRAAISQIRPVDWYNVVADYGADPTGVADSTTAIQAAINAAQALSTSVTVFGTANILNLVPTVYVPFGNYLVTGLHVAATAAFRLTGTAGSRLFSNAGTIFDFQNHVIQGLEIDHLTLDATGGHVFTNANLRFSKFHHLQLLQRSAGFSVWDQQQAGNQMQNTTFDEIIWWVCPDPTTGLRSVPAWKIYCDTGASFAEVTFSRMTGFSLPNVSGNRDNSQFFFDLACTAQLTSSYITQIAFRDCSFHRCLGGGIKAQSAVGLLVDHMTIQDIYNGAGGTGINLAASIINVGTYGTGPASRSVRVRNYHRGGTAATGTGVDPSDLTVSADTIDVRADGFIMSTTPASNAPQINLHGAAQAVIDSADIGLTVLNPAADTVIISGGTVAQAGNSVMSNDVRPETAAALGWNYDPMGCSATGSALVAQTVYAMRVDVWRTVTVGHLLYDVTSAGSGAVAANNWVGLYNSGGTQIAQAGIDTALGGGLQSIAVTANGGQTLTLVPGLYYVMIVVNATGMPSLARSGTSVPNIGTSGATLRVAVNATARTTLPSPATLTGNTGTGSFPFWVGLAA